MYASTAKGTNLQNGTSSPLPPVAYVTNPGTLLQAAIKYEYELNLFKQGSHCQKKNVLHDQSAVPEQYAAATKLA